MALTPDIIEQLARARADLRMGVPVVVTGDGAALILAAETLTPQRLADVLALGGAPVLAITARRAATLKARPYDGDLARLTLPMDASLAWVQAIADPADDLRSPMKGPLISARDGNPLAHRAALALCKSARLLPAAVVLPLEDAGTFAAQHALTTLPLSRLADHIGSASPLHPIVAARLPMEATEAGRLHIFRPEDGAEEHYAIEIGRPDRSKPVLARLHSACFTGDVLGSLKCDCGPQLRGALAQMGAQGAGVLLYLNQEGRGIGLANKMRAYSLQDQGFDTVEANHRLGFEDDERDFRLGADILKSMGFSSVRLLTNNPKKVDMMTTCGITVTERVPLKVGENRHNSAYLATKARKSGHLL
ncbi:GTP cyclohydrolase II [Pseudosulfitobacter pseudonitzschiae]|uniref:GTP cyclohydrolase II n=1 Tax=Pseudosulfitobacter pseudonitzschiae TaxID=1402135 RepID=UPI001AFA4978|nr:GTP cyclohydrolase II [Pseudosulfitobacter pseudonitzschiae]MBM1815840.1 GTP cyclohydrolase II [Pseudosulfitobacter pseudonitzschiae]MBM1832831.1 GTP cyclohydrolase II [Pseudosulfitobacter pseudonitzschiae]MBM1837699.1 GTP cyclohydrolase II [Pseudosulfitobacter pseudonitzschiae]MBM1842545.1 GTP cyclohydrolase II [Pseudosulfitobacter pseudonitzschiae]MBM1847413.1 GTP cyclohydrolase II [Pseudosulfitobacter pseudonitzschiae]